MNETYFLYGIFHQLMGDLVSGNSGPSLNIV